MAVTEELTIQAGDAQLAGTLTLPSSPPPDDRGGRHPGALLLPSWLPRDRDGAFDRGGHPAWFGAPEPGEDALLARLADALASHGVASLRCDPRGCGSSEGAWETVDLFTGIDDARDMVAGMRSQPRIDLRRMGIVGHGAGAGLAVPVAVSDPAIGALTLIGACARPYRDLLRRSVGARARGGRMSPHPIVRAIDRWSEEIIEGAERHEAAITLWLTGDDTIRLSLAGVEQAIHTPNRALVTMLHRSVTLVHGARDAWSDPDEAELLAEALRAAGNDPTLQLVADAGHDLAEAPDTVIDEMAADLAARLLPRELPPVLLAIEEMDATG